MTCSIMDNVRQVQEVVYCDYQTVKMIAEKTEILVGNCHTIVSRVLKMHCLPVHHTKNVDAETVQ